MDEDLVHRLQELLDEFRTTSNNVLEKLYDHSKSEAKDRGGSRPQYRELPDKDIQINESPGRGPVPVPSRHQQSESPGRGLAPAPSDRKFPVHVQGGSPVTHGRGPCESSKEGPAPVRSERGFTPLLRGSPDPRFERQPLESSKEDPTPVRSERGFTPLLRGSPDPRFERLPFESTKEGPAPVRSERKFAAPVESRSPVTHGRNPCESSVKSPVPVRSKHLPESAGRGPGPVRSERKIVPPVRGSPPTDATEGQYDNTQRCRDEFNTQFDAILGTLKNSCELYQKICTKKDKPYTPDISDKDKPYTPDISDKDKPCTPEKSEKDKPYTQEKSEKDKPNTQEKSEKDKPNTPEISEENKSPTPEEYYQGKVTLPLVKAKPENVQSLMNKNTRSKIAKYYEPQFEAWKKSGIDEKTKFLEYFKESCRQIYPWYIDNKKDAAEYTQHWVSEVLTSLVFEDKYVLHEHVDQIAIEAKQINAPPEHFRKLLQVIMLAIKKISDYISHLSSKEAQELGKVLRFALDMAGTPLHFDVVKIIDDTQWEVNECD